MTTTLEQSEQGYEAYNKAYKAYYKAYEAGKRLPELEPSIVICPVNSYYYALDIIKGRWIEAEDFIMTHPCYSYLYSVYVIEDKLPEKMHNMMILHAIKNPDDIDVKAYFKYLGFIKRSKLL